MGRREFFRKGKRIAALNAQAAPAFPGNHCPASGFLWVSGNVSFPAIETGRCFHVNGITVNKTTQPFESATAGGALHDPISHFCGPA